MPLDHRPELFFLGKENLDQKEKYYCDECSQYSVGRYLHSRKDLIVRYEYLDLQFLILAFSGHLPKIWIVVGIPVLEIVIIGRSMDIILIQVREIFAISYQR